MPPFLRPARVGPEECVHALGPAMQHNDDRPGIGRILWHVEPEFASEVVVWEGGLVPAGRWGLRPGIAPGTPAAGKGCGEEEQPRGEREMAKGHDARQSKAERITWKFSCDGL